MGLALEKCCCFIPLRMGTFIIALWFFAAYLIDAVTGFLGINAVIIYSGQTAKAWYYINLLFTVLVLIGGLAGLTGSAFAQRSSAKIFSVIVWICCGLSFIKYIISLALFIVYKQNMINTCIRSGFVSLGNSQVGLIPTTISTDSYYTPIKYPNTMNQYASSKEDCEQSAKLLIILWGTVIFVIQVVQIYFGSIANAYASRLRSGARHHRLHDQQIKEFEESRFHMSTVY